MRATNWILFISIKIYVIEAEPKFYLIETVDKENETRGEGVVKDAVSGKRRQGPLGKTANEKNEIKGVGVAEDYVSRKRRQGSAAATTPAPITTPALTYPPAPITTPALTYPPAPTTTLAYEIGAHISPTAPIATPAPTTTPAPEGKPRVIKMKTFLDDLMVAKYKEKFGEKYKEKASNIIKKLMSSASKYLKELDAGGYIAKMDEPLLLLSKSPYKIGNTYIARQTDNLKKDLEKKSDKIGYAFAFQDAVDDVESHQQSTDTILFIITPLGNSDPAAATEELCLCKNPPPFPCIGIFGVEMEPDYEISGMLLAHEIGHTLGVKEHDPTYGTIMYEFVSGGVWSQFSKDQVNKQNNSCLKEAESSEQYVKSSIMTESSEQYRRSGIMKTDAKNHPQDDRLSYYRSSYLLI